MKALILDGAAALRDLADPVVAALTSQLAARGHSVARHELAKLDVPDCRGDFGCWTVTPGVCVKPGPHRDVARDLIGSDLAVWLTPVTFGGYASALKKHLDHCIPLISPLMTDVEGETHHRPRYPRSPALLVLGLAETREPAEARIFERLAARNALYLHAPRCASAVLDRGDLPAVTESVARALDGIEESPPAAPGGEPVDLGAATDLPRRAPRRALLLVGSPRGTASVSAAVTEHLGSLLRGHGVEVATEIVVDRRRGDPGLRRLATAVGEADLVVLAAPLYVDALPAPLTEALELVAAARAESAGDRPRLLAIVNCGFPEAVHTDTALAICRAFARRANLDWIGGLGIGGGGMLAGKPLRELGGRAQLVTRALELTAAAVSRGEVVPGEAQRLVGKLPIPVWLYRLMADWGFRNEARKHGIWWHLGDRPYGDE